MVPWNYFVTEDVGSLYINLRRYLSFLIMGEVVI